MKKPVFDTKTNEGKEENTSEKDRKKQLIFVTGGTGRLGRILITNLLKRGHAVRALAESKEQLFDIPSGAVPYVGDISDKALLKEACKGVDTVFHLAAIVSEYKAYTGKLMSVNVDGTANVLEAASENKVKHFIFTSTVDVYGRARKTVLNEDSKLMPSDKYGYSKMLAEQEVENYKGKMDYTIFRMAAIYGPGFEASYFKAFKAIKELKASYIGNGENHLSLLHINDLINAFVLALNNAASRNKIYNLSDGVSYTQKRLFGIIADLLGVEKPKRHISPLIVKLVAKSRGLDSDELRFLTSDRIIDIKKIKDELGFAPSVAIKEGGAELVKLFLNKYTA